MAEVRKALNNQTRQYFRLPRGKKITFRLDPGDIWWKNFAWAWFEMGEVMLGLGKLKVDYHNPDGSIQRKWRERKARAYLRKL